MDTRKIILLVGALVVAAVCTFLVRGLVADSAAPSAVAQTIPTREVATGPKILVAQKALPIGTIIKPEDVVFQPWPEDLVQNAYFIEGQNQAPESEGAPGEPASLDDAVGKVVRVSISAGQPVSRRAIVGPGENGFLAAALGKGMRAITVPIDNISGVAGFIFPGDRVDLLLVQTLGETGESAAATKASGLRVAETLVRNIRVLAIDQRSADLATQGPQVGRTVTFEVPPKVVEKITVAQSLGKLSLSLRSLVDQRAAVDLAIAEGRIALGEDDEGFDEAAMEYALRQAPDDSGSTYTTGGEVSRFALSRRGIKRKGDGTKPGESVRVTRGTKRQVVAVQNTGAAAPVSVSAATSAPDAQDIN